MRDEGSAIEIASIIKEQATISLGPWSKHIQILIIDRGDCWKVGVSSATQQSQAVYRNEVLAIAKRLQKTVRLRKR
jgi:hypothetical protein